MIDNDTGSPIAGAFVIAEGVIRQKSMLTNGSVTNAYRIVVETDTSGNFLIPAQTNHMEPVAFDFSGTKYEWSVVPIALGYVVDIDQPFVHFEPPITRAYPHALLSTPAFTSTVDGIKIADFKMMKSDLTIPQEVGYFILLNESGQHPWEQTPEEEARIAPALLSHIVPEVCLQPQRTRFSADTVGDLLDISRSGEQMRQREKRLQELEPDGFQRGMNNMSHRFLASNVCRIFTEEQSPGSP